MKIAIIDSGLDSQHTYKNANIVQARVEEERIDYVASVGDEIGHGTACTDLILRYCPDAEIYVYKVFTNELVIEPQYLIRALKECKMRGIDMVNLSMGMVTKAHFDELNEICRELVDDGIVLVAAGSENNSIRCWPADFSYVIKVNGSSSYDKNGYYLIDEDNLGVGAFGGREIVKWIGGKENIVAGGSFACARVTGILAAQLIKNNTRIGIEPILSFLSKNALSNLSDAMDKCSLPRKWLRGKRTALFPFNKEMHSLVRFEQTVGHRIEAIADFALSRNVGKDAGLCIGMQAMGTIVNAGFLSLIETNAEVVVLGDLSEISRLHNKDYIKTYALKAFEAGKDVASIELQRNDEYLHLKQMAMAYGREFVSLNDYLESMKQGRGPNVEFRAPLLCILGSGPQVGKFTFQVKLKGYLERVGYTVDSVCTESQGYLFGYETVPLGNAVFLEYIPFEDQIEFLRQSIVRVQQEEDNDLLIIGGQSGVVPYSPQVAVDYNSLSSILTILSAKPDGFILCINPNDDMEYLERTIRGIEAFGYGAVMLCIMSSLSIESKVEGKIRLSAKRVISDDERAELCERYTKSLGIPVCGFQEAGEVIEVITTIQNYFCA